MDWVTFETEFTAGLDEFTQNAVAANPADSVYCVAIYMFYTDYTQVLLPMFSAATAGWLSSMDDDDREASRWHPPDYPIQQEGDFDNPNAFYRRACDWLTAEARAADPDSVQRDKNAGCDAVVDRANAVIARAARVVMDQIRSEGTVQGGLLVLPLDENWDPQLDLVRRVLSEAELQAHPTLLEYLVEAQAASSADPASS